MLASQILSGLLIKAFLFFSRYEAGTIIEFGIMIDYHTPLPPKKSENFSRATSSEERYEKLKKKSKFHDWLWGDDII